MVVNAVAVLLEFFCIPVILVGGVLGQECVVLSHRRAVFGCFFAAF